MSATQSTKPTVAVITSTVGRIELERAIFSVQNQTYPCKHYIFVDGEKYHQQAADILNKFDNLTVTYLPMNTGANGWTNSSINAIAPFLIKEDIVCFLDDDNWFEPNHVETGVNALIEHQSGYAYALRKFYDSDGNFICVDTMESIGDYSRGYGEPLEFPFQINETECVMNISGVADNHIDTNCYFMTAELARFISSAWYSGIHNDRNVYAKLKEFGVKGACTKAISVNYILDPAKYIGGLNVFFEAPFFFNKEQACQFVKEMVKFSSEKSVEGWGGRLIWE
ncbi:glycosyltransferase family 2 protein [Mannheimia granulomatis]|uniref:glycosyltransferase family 2 protein n=1 Tax=Mannheimia granulomatis TaxID=85402 RepID=UPI001404D87E|nr:glycosyltransferase family 2 protein [Mannheimia granulomatis]